MFNGLEKFVCNFFGLDLDNDYPNGWINSYATIDPVEKTVTELYFFFESNAGTGNDKELGLKITNYPEQTALYAALSDQELDDFVAEAYSEFYESKDNTPSLDTTNISSEKVRFSQIHDIVKNASNDGVTCYLYYDNKFHEVEYLENGMYPAEIAVETTAGVLKAYRSVDPGQPGIAIVAQPAGFDCEIDMAYVSVYEDMGYQTYDMERDVDFVVMAYGNPSSEDYTSKDIIRREHVFEALDTEEYKAPLLSPEECAIVWQKIVRCYKISVEKNENPTDTVERILKAVGDKDRVLQTFATVAQIKKHDGRIYGKNREFMVNYPVNEAATIWDSSNPLIRAGLDDIHTTHINQLITELIK